MFVFHDDDEHRKPARVIRSAQERGFRVRPGLDLDTKTYGLDDRHVFNPKHLDLFNEPSGCSANQKNAYYCLLAHE